MAEQLTAVLTKEPGGEYSIVLLYPSVAMQGKTIEEAKEAIAGGLILLLEGLKKMPDEGRRVRNLEPASKQELNRLEQEVLQGKAIDHGFIDVSGVNGPSYLSRDYEIRIIERRAA